MHLSFFGIFHIEAWFIKERIPFFTSRKRLVLDGGAFNYLAFFCQYVILAGKMSHNEQMFKNELFLLPHLTMTPFEVNKVSKVYSEKNS